MSASVFALQGSISMDSSGFEKAVKEAVEEGKKLAQALSENTAQMKSLQDSISKVKTQLDSADKSMKEAAESTEDMAKETKKTTDATEGMSKEVDDLKSDLNKAKKAIEDTTDETKKLSERMDKTEEETDELKKEVKKLEDQYKKTGNESDELDDKTKKLGDTAEKASGKFGKFAEFLKNGFVTALKVSVGAITAAGTAITGLVTKSVSSFGEYEQLKGGAQKIFEGMDFTKIQEDADKAFKELNMSASEYFQSINLAGATFAQTMGSEKAYETARKGMIAISDFATGTGEDIATLNEKYKLITRSATSYQSIADQFAGILPQTTTDFLKQAQAAGYLSNSYEKLTDVPIAEYQQAVTDMIVKGVEAQGLASNTANEAERTLTGSFTTVKKAWDNLVVAFSDPDANLDVKLKDFTDSAEAALRNIVPTIQNALGGIGKAVTELAPVLEEQLPKLVGELVPPLLEATMGLIDSLVGALPGMLTTITDKIKDGKVIKKVSESAKQLFSGLITGAKEVIVNLTSALPSLLVTIGRVLKGDDGIIKQIGAALKEAVPQVLDNITDLMEVILDVLPELITDLGDVITDLLPELFPKILETFWTLVDMIANSDLFDSVASLIMPLMEALLEAAEKAYPIVFELIPQVIEDLFNTIGRYFEENKDSITLSLEHLVLHVIDFLKGYIPAFLNVMIDLIAALIAGLWDNIPKIYEPFKNAFEDLGEWLFDVSEKFKAWRDETIQKVWDFFVNLGEKFYDWRQERIQNLKDFIDSIIQKASEFKTKIIDKILEIKDLAVEKVVNMGKDLVKGLWDGILSMKDWIQDKISMFSDNVIDGFKAAFGIASPSKVMRDLIGSNLAEGIGVGFSNTMKDISADMLSSLKMFEALAIPNLEQEISVNDTAGSSLVSQGTTSGITIVNNISLDGARISSDYDLAELSDELLEKINEGLAQLDVFQTRAYGGVTI